MRDTLIEKRVYLAKFKGLLDNTEFREYLDNDGNYDEVKYNAANGKYYSIFDKGGNWYKNWEVNDAVNNPDDYSFSFKIEDEERPDYYECILIATNKKGLRYAREMEIEKPIVKCFMWFFHKDMALKMGFVTEKELENIGLKNDQAITESIDKGHKEFFKKYIKNN